MTKPNSAAGSTSFLVAAIGIYVAYFLHGASVIALAQNMSALAEKFATDSAGIAYLISGIGLGRLVTILFFGALSDKFGRRSMILLGLVLYVLFFLGIPYSPNLTIAFILAFCVGAANSAIDTGGYPAMIECFPKASSSAVILLKAMVSFGQMLYPMCVSFLMVSGLWYGWAFIVPGAILIVLSLFIIKCRFPGTNGSGAAGADVPQMRAKPKMMLEGLVAVVFLRGRRLDAALRRSLRRHDGSRIAHHDLLLLHRLARLRLRLCLPSEEQGALRLGHDAQRSHRLRRICGAVPLPLALRVHGRRFPDRLLCRGRHPAARRGCDGGILP